MRWVMAVKVGERPRSAVAPMTETGTYHHGRAVRGGFVEITVRNVDRYPGGASRTRPLGGRYLQVSWSRSQVQASELAVAKGLGSVN